MPNVQRDFVRNRVAFVFFWVIPPAYDRTELQFSQANPVVDVAIEVVQF